MNTNNVSTMELNITAKNCEEVKNIIDDFHILKTNPFLNNKSLSIFNINLYNCKKVINSIDKLYKIDAIDFSDWAVINLKIGLVIGFM